MDIINIFKSSHFVLKLIFYAHLLIIVYSKLHLVFEELRNLASSFLQLSVFLKYRILIYLANRSLAMNFCGSLTCSFLAYQCHQQESVAQVFFESRNHSLQSMATLKATAFQAQMKAYSIAQRGFLCLGSFHQAQHSCANCELQ